MRLKASSKWLTSMNNVDYVVICANQGVNKCNLLVHPDPGLDLPVLVTLSTMDCRSSLFTVAPNSPPGQVLINISTFSEAHMDLIFLVCFICWTGHYLQLI